MRHFVVDKDCKLWRILSICRSDAGQKPSKHLALSFRKHWDQLTNATQPVIAVSDFLSFFVECMGM